MGSTCASRWGWALLILAGLGCAELEPLAIDVCGNRVVERGEDCDGEPDPLLGPGLRCGATDGARACRYVCDAGVTCPVGWGCGVDGICRNPSGELDSASLTLEHFAPASFDADDVDGDGLADVVGRFVDRIEWRFSDSLGGFHGAWISDALPTEGPVVFADLDGDAQADVASASALGLEVWRGSAQRAPSEVNYAPFLIPEGIAWLSPLPSVGAGAPALILMLSSAEGTTVANLIDSSTGKRHEPVVLAADYSLDSLSRDLPIADFGGDGTLDLALAPSGKARVDVHRVRLDPFLAEWGFELVASVAIDEPCTTRACVTQAVNLRVGLGARFGDMDGDGRLDLLISTDDGRVVVAPDDGQGKFGQPYIDARFDALAKPSGDASQVGQRWPLAVADLNQDGIADAVGTDGIYLGSVGASGAFTLSQPRFGSEPWSTATVADFDGDGLGDVVAARVGSPFVDFMRCVSPTTSCVEAGTFMMQRQTLGSAVTHLSAGHLRGNAGTDVLVATPAADAPSSQSELVLIASRSGDWPDAAMRVARVDTIERMAIGRTTHPAFQTVDEFDDVFVTTQRDSLRAFGVLFGSPNQHFASPLFLIGGWINGKVQYGRPRIVLAGRFFETTEAGLGVVVVGDVAAAAPRLWALPPRPRAQFLPADQPLNLVHALGGAFSVECSRWAAGDFDGDGLDEVAVANPECAAAGNVATVALASPRDRDLGFQPIGALMTAPVLAAQALDLDGDGRSELVLLGTTSVQVRWGSSLAGSEEFSHLDLPAELGPIRDTGVLDVVGTGVRPTRLVVLGANGLAVIGSSADRLVSVSGAAKVSGRQVRAGDVDGDGLEDVLVLGDDALLVLRSTPRANLGDP